MDGIGRIVGGSHVLPASGKGGGTKGLSFGDTLKSFTRHVDSQIKEADRKSEEFAVGKREDIQEVMIASEKADLTLRLFLQIRNKLLEAYQEVARMQF